MTVIAPDCTLADLVTEIPAAARVLDHLGLDYCCHGRERLDQACAARGVDLSVVMEELALLATAPVPAPAWVGLAPVELVDHLEATHHVFLRAELPRLSELAAKVSGVHGDRHAELVEVRSSFEALRGDLEPHLLKEERILFPMIRELATSPTLPSFHCGSLGAPISVMLAEHDRAGELLGQLRGLTDGFRCPDDGCRSYRALYDGLGQLEADTHLHVYKENHLLFPAVIALELERSGVVGESTV